ncbi:hypothetical protein [Mucilaginibacter sp.]|uniref:hypothetical protein n=1 Tax=Mucilaginibacter sp. TaxID=1882438 RepID=UPI002610A97B|nr:hypothetical protein [Mucilaginibacter sp.]
MKRSKNQVSKEASLRSRPLPVSPGKTTGCKIFAPLRTLLPHAQQKIAMPFPTLLATSFTCPHPKLFADTLHNTNIMLIIKIGCNAQIGSKSCFIAKNRQTGSFGRNQVKQGGPCGCKGIGNFA